MFAYSNNGHDFRAVEDGYVAQPGEVLFSDYATSDELRSAFPSYEPVVATRIIYKADIWRRATDAEAVTIDAALNSQPIRLRRMWQDSQTLATTDEMYPMVKTAFKQAFGAERAAALLEPTA